MAKGIAPDIFVAVSAEDERAYFGDAFKVLSRPVAQLRARKQSGIDHFHQSSAATAPSTKPSW